MFLIFQEIQTFFWYYRSRQLLFCKLLGFAVTILTFPPPPPLLPPLQKIGPSRFAIRQHACISPLMRATSLRFDTVVLKLEG